MRPQDRGGMMHSQTRTREGTLGVAVVGQGWWGRAIESPSASQVLAGLEAFAAAARGRAPYPIAQHEMIATISALEAIIKSAASGQIEQVEG